MDNYQELIESLRSVTQFSRPTKLAHDAADAIQALQARVSELEAKEAATIEMLNLMKTPAFPDPDYHIRVKKLGREIGFGALMSTAEAGWREALKEDGHPIGGEFVAGPCRAHVAEMLKIFGMGK